MKLYCCQPTVNGQQVPTFYLHPDVQGIVSEEHAARIACRILNRMNDPDLTVSPNVTAVHLTEQEITDDEDYED